VFNFARLYTGRRHTLSRGSGLTYGSSYTGGRHWNRGSGPGVGTGVSKCASRQQGLVANTTGISCTSFVALGAAADARLGARGAKTAGLLAQVAGVAGAAEGCRLLVRLAPSSAQTLGRGVVFTHWRRREPAQGGRVGICVAIVFAGLFHCLAHFRLLRFLARFKLGGAFIPARILL